MLFIMGFVTVLIVLMIVVAADRRVRMQTRSRESGMLVAGADDTRSLREQFAAFTYSSTTVAHTLQQIEERLTRLEQAAGLPRPGAAIENGHARVGWPECRRQHCLGAAKSGIMGR
jgi:uncharacterized membrane protein